MTIELTKPYFYTPDSLPGLDFNREIVEPGTHEHFPEGAIGIRADGDFWTVAALPYSYLDTPLRDIVAQLWPQYLEQATFEPDSGTVEQTIHFLKLSAKGKDRTIKSLNKRVHELSDELERLRGGRSDLHERHPTRRRAVDDYFIRQYEHLLIATAHKAIPREDKPGICLVCGLLAMSDRVHQQHYIDLHNAGYPPDMKHLVEYDRES